MPSVPQTIKMRERRQKLHRRPYGSLGLGCSAVISLLAATMLVVLALAYSSLSQGLPSLETLPILLDPPDGLLLQPTRIYDRSGQQVLLSLENPAAAERQYLFYSQGKGSPSASRPALPTSLISATVAISDPTFWTNWGFTAQDLRPDSHPTVAQRLVSELLLWNEKPGLRRALRERLLATQITSRFGRDKVLEWYLNSANYGHLAYGADAAARVYFGKPAVQLSLAEAALLAGVAQAPALNPLDAPQAALESQSKVLQTMQDQGLISSQKAGQARAEKLEFRSENGVASPGMPAFANLVLSQLENQVSRERVERGGLKITTSLDADLQRQATCAAQAQLERLRDPSAGASPAQAAGCAAARLLPTLPIPAGARTSGLDANIVILDPIQGQILAMVGQASSGLDNLPGHPPGTLLTPFIYLTAFSRGMSPGTLIWDIPGELPISDVHNFDGRYHGPLRLRMALANDYLAPAVQLLAQLGANNVWRTAQQLGLDSLTAASEQEAYSLPGEGGSISLLEISQAYSVFANRGALSGRTFNAPVLHPTAVLQVKDSSNRTWLDWSDSQTQPLISSQLSYLITNVLSDETARWPSLGHPNPLEIGRPAAGKLGRTLQGQDTWAVGYTPQLVIGVWIGASQDAQEAASGGQVPPSAAAALWHALIQYASRNLPSETWSTPSGITTVEVCDPSGLLPTTECPAVVNEVFLDSNQPTHADDLYKALQINRETGRLATIFTPADLVQEQVYMNIPPEARDWARSAGMQLPPESYDVIAGLGSSNPQVTIQTPSMFAQVQGKVIIQGSASGGDFSYYRLQVGQGLNPQNWLQIGEDSSRPVSNGQLGVWDTSDLSGLYALQLLVVRQDQRVDSAIIQVTVDNQPPVVEIPYPSDGESIEIGSSGTLVFQAQVSDDLKVNEVRFYVDDRLVGTLQQAPFAFPWAGQAGKHTLRVEASDLAGNASQASSDFTVVK